MKIRFFANRLRSTAKKPSVDKKLLTLARVNIAREYGTCHCSCLDVSPCICNLVSDEYARLVSGTGGTILPGCLINEGGI